MDVLKTQKLAALIALDERFEILNNVVYPLVCFRLRGRSSEDTEKLFNEMNATKKIFMVLSSEIGITFIRITFGGQGQSEEHVLKNWELLKTMTDLFFRDLQQTFLKGDKKN